MTVLAGRLRAERRGGKLLGETELHNGDPRSHDVTRLADLGITKMQSHRWVGEKRKDPDFAQPPASRQHFDVWRGLDAFKVTR